MDLPLRKRNLLDFAKDKKASIGDAAMQLGIPNEGVEGLLSWCLYNFNECKVGKRCFLLKVLLDFERPADQSYSAQSRRAGMGQGFP